MKKFTKLLPLILLVLTSCLRLDDNLFNPDNSIDAYYFDDYSGEVIYEIDSAYDIAENKRHLIPLQSQAEGEAEATTIYGLFIGDISQIATDTIIMYCHGNRDHLDHYWPQIKLLANIGGKHRYGVMALDYRGYGLSEGSPTEEGLYADVNTALQWLKDNGLTDGRLVMYGMSMGTAPATELTANPRALTPAKLILEAPFASAEVMAQDATKLALPGSYVTSLQINNAEEIKKVQQPFMWIHGVDDSFLSIKTHGEVVYKNYSGSYSEAHRITGAEHSQSAKAWGFENYLKTLEAFIER